MTDVCWSCLFPVKIAGGVPVSASGALPDPQVSVPPVCVCGKGTNLRAGITMSFWEPLRTAEIVRHPGCLPTMGGVSLGDLGLRVSAHSKVHAKTDDGSMRRHTAFWQVHWYNTPWLFVLEALLDQSCLEQMPWDLAYLSPDEYYQFCLTGVYPLNVPIPKRCQATWGSAPNPEV